MFETLKDNWEYLLYAYMAMCYIGMTFAIRYDIKNGCCQSGGERILDTVIWLFSPLILPILLALAIVLFAAGFVFGVVIFLVVIPYILFWEAISIGIKPASSNEELLDRWVVPGPDEDIFSPVRLSKTKEIV